MLPYKGSLLGSMLSIKLQQAQAIEASLTLRWPFHTGRFRAYLPQPPTLCEGFSQVKLHADTRPVKDMLMLWCLDRKGPLLGSSSSATHWQEHQLPT